MKKYGENVKKKYGEYILFALICMAGFILHYVVGDFPKRIDCVPDEVKYISIARSIFLHRGLQVRGINTSFQKVLYSLVISPLFGIGNHLHRIKAINLLNCIMMGSSSIPLILISKQLNLSKKYTYFILVLFLIWPETFITATFMTESLYWPLVFWFIYLWLRNEQCVSILNTILMSLVCYLGYMDKEAFMALFAACIVSEAWGIWASFRKQAIDKKRIINLFVFIFVFALIHIILKSTIFKGLGNSYANQIGLKEILNLKCILYILYAIFYYIVSCAVVLAIAPVTYVVLFRKRFDKMAVKLLRMLGLVLAITIASIAYSISAREDLFSLCPRLHIRYFAPVLLLMIMLFLLACQQSDKKIVKELNNRFMFITVLFFAAGILVFRGATNGSAVDYFSFKWYQALSAGAENTFVLSIIIVLIMLTVTFILWVNTVQNGKVIMLISMLVATVIFSDFIAFRDLRTVYAITDDEENEMQEMSNFINQNCNDEDNIVYFSDHQEGIIQAVLIDTYIDARVIFTDVSQLESMQTEHRLVLIEPLSQTVYEGINKIDYIIMNNTDDTISLLQNFEAAYQNNMYKIIKTNITIKD